MRKSIKGFYTLEAAIFLPVMILVILSLGYYIRIEGLWEKCMHGALDESGKIAAKMYGKGYPYDLSAKIRKRLIKDNDNIGEIDVRTVAVPKSGIFNGQPVYCKLHLETDMKLPLGLGREFELDTGIKFRGFVGKKSKKNPLGRKGLEEDKIKDPVWVFPYCGVKYHKEVCTYVKAAVKRKVLTRYVQIHYRACKICDSNKMRIGATVFCFNSEKGAYHRGSCRTIKRHTVVMDKTDAKKKGYKACSKCGGS